MFYHTECGHKSNCQEENQTVFGNTLYYKSVAPEAVVKIVRKESRAGAKVYEKDRHHNKSRKNTERT